MKLRQKSSFNEDASEVLINKSLFAPSVHCSYYASFQLMKHVCNSKLGISYDKIDTEVRSSTFGEHAYVRKEILNIINKHDKSNYRMYERLMKNLYQYRIISDYKNEEITIDKASKAKEFSKSIINYIADYFHV